MVGDKEGQRGGSSSVALRGEETWGSSVAGVSPKWRDGEKERREGGVGAWLHPLPLLLHAQNFVFSFPPLSHLHFPSVKCMESK